MLLDFVPYQINSSASDGCSFLWFGSEVHIVLVSTNNMNQENEGSVPSPTSTASQVSETFIADGICYFTTMRGKMFSKKAKEPLVVIFVSEKVILFQLQCHGKIEHYFPALTSRSARMHAVLR